MLQPLLRSSSLTILKHLHAPSTKRYAFPCVRKHPISLLPKHQHNRVYDGRTLRVQLRDVNPPRTNWKFARGRGRFHQPRRFHYRPFVQGQNIVRQGGSDLPISESMGVPREMGSSIACSLPANHDKTSSKSPSTFQPIESSSSISNIFDDAHGPERYREWYDNLESPASTPAPSSLGSSASASGVAYTTPSYPYMPNGTHFLPPPWLHPYMSSGPYSLPYYPGYPLYPPPPVNQHPQSLTPPNSGSSGSSHPIGQWPAFGVYGVSVVHLRSSSD
jgi:hypothetical protein